MRSAEPGDPRGAAAGILRTGKAGHRRADIIIIIVIIIVIIIIIIDDQKLWAARACAGGCAARQWDVDRCAGFLQITANHTCAECVCAHTHSARPAIFPLRGARSATLSAIRARSATLSPTPQPKLTDECPPGGACILTEVCVPRPVPPTPEVSCSGCW